MGKHCAGNAGIKRNQFTTHKCKPLEENDARAQKQQTASSRRAYTRYLRFNQKILHDAEAMLDDAQRINYRAHRPPVFYLYTARRVYIAADT